MSLTWLVHRLGVAAGAAILVATMAGCALGAAGGTGDDDWIRGDEGKVDDFSTGYSLESFHPITSYEQDDPQWGSELLYGGRTCKDSIGDKGCALTAHAMILSYYGGTQNPSELNRCIADDRSFDHCDLIWSGCLTPETSYTYGDGSLSSIRTELDRLYPVAAFVRKSDHTECHHFVVVTGYNTPGTKRADFEILDPATGTKRSLGAYAQVCSTRLIRGPVGSVHWTGPVGSTCAPLVGCELTVVATNDITAVQFSQVLDGSEVPLASGTGDGSRSYTATIFVPAGPLTVRARGLTALGNVVATADRQIVVE
jgi:hypothetical protein